jgi:hypothetical protein
MTATTRRWAGALLVMAVAVGCEREVRVGAAASPSSDGAPAADAAGARDALPPPRWPWTAGHERDDLSEWLERSPGAWGGSFHSDGGAALSLVTDQAHSGRYAVKATIEPDKQAVRYAKLYRQGGLPTEARYGAWFYLPVAVQVDDYWNLVQWTDESGMLWDIGVVTHDGHLELYAFDHQRRKGVPKLLAIPVPIGRWFEISTVFRKATDATGTFTVAQDGVTVIDVRNIGTVGEPASLQWNVGSAALALSPTPATIYLDDAWIEPL